MGCEVGAALLGTGTLQGSSAEWSCPDGYVAVVVFSPTKKKLKDVSIVWLVRMHCEEEFCQEADNNAVTGCFFTRGFCPVVMFLKNKRIEICI